MKVDHWTIGEIWSAAPCSAHSRALSPASHQMAFEALLWPEGQHGPAWASNAGELKRFNMIQQGHMSLMNFHEFPEQCTSHNEHQWTTQMPWAPLHKFDTLSTGENYWKLLETFGNCWTQHRISLDHLMQPASHFVTPLGVAKASTGRSCDSILGRDAGRPHFHWFCFRENLQKTMFISFSIFYELHGFLRKCCIMLHIYAYLSCTVCCDKSSWLRTMTRRMKFVHDSWHLMTVPDFFK